MKNKIAITTLATLIALTGCSSSPPEPETELASKLIELEKAQRELKELREYEQERRLEIENSKTPQWAMQPPAPDGSAVYGVGISESKNLNHAMRTARLRAEFDVAGQLKGELSGSNRDMTRGNSSGEVTESQLFLIDRIVDSVPVVGYQVVESETVIMNGKIHAFVLLRLPFDEFNQVLQSQRNSEVNNQMRAEFDDLERRLAVRRQLREQEIEAEHRREQDRYELRARTLREANAPPEVKEEKPNGSTL
ncbi:hypothetical protein [Aliidiomarina quisquiliarum]|uniref:hypothetical protein n=1 Tax=Aliidiomarina quisquiliarum TaxID=2938947 RepID=UPI00208F5E4E|nr:hypothetical protein [Aliidiomarina quisquiliarum]MCO4320035.1 hypothetical protein [Aliidiomarina quisquiliarum]